MSLIQKFIKASFIVLTIAASSFTFAADDTREAVKNNTAKIGSTCVVGASCAAAPVAASNAARSGSDVYEASCKMCHANGVAGAPVFGDAGAWSARIAKGNDVLYGHVINGFNAMPAKGGCATCSDDEIKSAVDFIISQSQ